MWRSGAGLVCSFMPSRLAALRKPHFEYQQKACGVESKGPCMNWMRGRFTRILPALGVEDRGAVSGSWTLETQDKCSAVGSLRDTCYSVLVMVQCKRIFSCPCSVNELMNKADGVHQLGARHD